MRGHFHSLTCSSGSVSTELFENGWARIKLHFLVVIFIFDAAITQCYESLKRECEKKLSAQLVMIENPMKNSQVCKYMGNCMTANSGVAWWHKRQTRSVANLQPDYEISSAIIKIQ